VRAEPAADIAANRAESVQRNSQEPVAEIEVQATRLVLLENRKLVTKRKDLRLWGSTGTKTGD
jgi:hypothetical protein